MTVRRTPRTKPQVDMNLVSLTDWQYREMESESEHQDSGLPVPKKSTKKEKTKKARDAGQQRRGEAPQSSTGYGSKKKPQIPEFRVWSSGLVDNTSRVLLLLLKIRL
jgi:hypothetical protein